ncbi:hypothetical protein IE53DRAFT_389144 [Violaceomyces palustris]|uniref:Uncharacterized protein n=1 Tax=Violaceomyces palustris TaxID=1673888 RepID=A0ACD0NS49_9BASI|nr:hypothetical protein IE53DRAFT_389144 [Violaceomyces palustris]
MDPLSKLKSKFVAPSFTRPPGLANHVASNSTTPPAPHPNKRPRLTLPLDSSEQLDQEHHGTQVIPSDHALIVRKSSSSSITSPVARRVSSSENSPIAIKPTLSNLNDGPFYLCQWRKPQFKKHKTWDGDAVLIVKDGGERCSLRCAETGKELASQAKFGHGILGSGDELTIAGKEIEIERQISRQEYLTGMAPAPVAEASRPSVAAYRKLMAGQRAASGTGTSRGLDPRLMTPAKASLFYAKPNPKPRSDSPIKAPGLLDPGQGKKPHPRFDPKTPGAIVMKRPELWHQKLHNRHGREVVDVVIDPQVAASLRPHQVEGVKFLYERVMGMHSDGEKGQGCILADEMGLGKTLQTITLVLTLLKQNCYYTPQSQTIERALIVCPLSLVKNWKREFRKWIGANSLGIMCIDGEGRGKEDVERFVRSKQYQVLVIGYEKMRSCIKTLKEAQPPIGLIVCDEGHRLKSRDAKTTKMFDDLRTPRRVILSGTPIQNDLSEFYSMLDFVSPGLLGEYSVFKKLFEDPIMKSRAQHCSKSVREIGESRSTALVKVTHDIILRRTAEILNSYLKPKHEMVVFCSPTKLQLDIYRHFLGSKSVREVLAGGAGSGLLQISVLRKLCNSPELLLKDLTGQDSATKSLLGDALSLFPSRNIAYDACFSGKFICALKLLSEIHKHTKDKVVFVSNFTTTLDIMERILRKRRYTYVRLDGKTKQEERMDIVNDFNRGSQNSSFVFLLSARSGGVGLNLIGANRLVLFDSDWNPSTDQQAMARIHRDGQTKPCYIYRMLLTGTMDEKIYQRQLSKIGLSDSLMNNGGGSTSKTSSDTFTQEELKDIFTLHTDTPCLSHRQLGCTCRGKGEGCDAAQEVKERSCIKNIQDYEGDSSEDEMPGFVPASQHVAKSIDSMARDKRAKLAALHDWSHFNCCAYPECFDVDPIVSKILGESASSKTVRPADVVPCFGSGVEELNKEPKLEEAAVDDQNDDIPEPPTSTSPPPLAFGKFKAEKIDEPLAPPSNEGEATEQSPEEPTILEQLDPENLTRICEEGQMSKRESLHRKGLAQVGWNGVEDGQTREDPYDLLEGMDLEDRLEQGEAEYESDPFQDEEMERFSIQEVPPGSILFIFAKSSLSSVSNP